ncbi:hypothetical protein RirG_247890 [Rhizophagus irregularis DAOM 197198w]|uniref:DUF6570 domain-containing protein n=1 Tax=Rhizophagus irregularis (strain DAOM 197198w) TaxID=1432141 RepID=A0A015K0T4_RHIIW|nr:hypothetical protein RirG_247890 [Rhizophagus irregularis DAOM 197198w]
MTETNSDRENQKNRENQRRQAACKRSRNLKNQNVLKGRNINQQTRQDHERRKIEETYLENDNTDSDSQPTSHSATTLSEEEISMLQDFCIKMDNINYKLCIVCQERIPLLTLVKGTCKRCYYEKNIWGTPKKFSEGNNMHPGEVPNELKGLSEIEEMLIFQVFTVMTVYQLRGEQNGYRGHVINFPQDIQDDESGEDDGDNIEDGEDVSRMFVLLMPATQREDEAINATLDQMQNDNPPSLWPEIEGVPINEFHTPGYMVRAFPRFIHIEELTFIQHVLKK